VQEMAALLVNSMGSTLSSTGWMEPWTSSSADFEFMPRILRRMQNNVQKNVMLSGVYDITFHDSGFLNGGAGPTQTAFFTHHFRFRRRIGAHRERGALPDRMTKPATKRGSVTW
jgi:hypothetical protein